MSEKYNQDGAGSNEPAVAVVQSAVSFFDQEEIVENCTVQILTNTKTGEVSVGWWRNEV